MASSSEKSQESRGTGDCSRIRVVLLSTILVEETEFHLDTQKDTAFEGEMSEEMNCWLGCGLSHMEIIQEP